MGAISFGTNPITGDAFNTDVQPGSETTINTTPPLINTTGNNTTENNTTPPPVNTDNGGSAFTTNDLPPAANTATTATTLPNSIGSGFDWTSLFNGVTGLAGGLLKNTQGGEYLNQAQGLANQLNPYGSYRGTAAQALANLQTDPSSVVNTPGYKFALSQGLGSVFNRDNRSFGVGAGSTNPDAMNYAEGLASKTYNDTVSQLSAQAGVNIGPSAAAQILSQGLSGDEALKQAGLAQGTAGVQSLLTPGNMNAIGQMLQQAGLSPAQIAQTIKNLFPNGSGTPNTNIFTDSNGNPIDTSTITSSDGSQIYGGDFSGNTVTNPLTDVGINGPTFPTGDLNIPGLTDPVTGLPLTFDSGN